MGDVISEPSPFGMGQFQCIIRQQGHGKGGGGAVVPMPVRGSTRHPGENPLLTQCEPPSKNPDDFAPGQRVTRT